MAHKTFISYKYSDARDVRDRIIEALGDDATYYQGERSDSPDLSDKSNERIKKILSEKMFDTSVTIVVLSPEMTDSAWISWEVGYCLKKIARKNRTSQRNGVVGVIKKVNGGYGWFERESTNCHGVNTLSYEMSKTFDVISNNHFNSKPPKWHCDQCKTYDSLDGSYISFVEEDEFISNPTKYIENAYKKSENDASGYEIYIN